MPEVAETERTSREVAERLAGRIDGDLLTDRFSRTAYATAACIYKMTPLAVVVPKTADDVQETVRAATDLGVPIIPRGAGSGVCGQVVGRGIVLDFTRYMNEIIEIEGDGELVRVQPGVVTGKINEALRPLGRMLGPDPSSEEFCTIGGNLGNNASGARGIRYGSTKDYVAWLDVVMADGTRTRLEPVGADGEAWQATVRRDDLLGRAAAGTRELLEQHAELIEQFRPHTSKNSAGYNLFEVLRNGTVDLTRLVVGSEGTLAVVVEAGIRTVPRPSERASMLLWFETLEAAGDAIEPILELGPSACEIMEKRFLDIVRADGSVPVEYLPERAEAVVLVEQLSGDRESNEAFMASVRRRVVDELDLAFDAASAYDPEEQVRLWTVRKRAVQILQRLPGPKRITPFVEDVTVPPARLAEYIRGLREIFDRFEVDAAIYGHAGDSNLHARPILDTREAEDVAKMKGIAAAVAELTVGLGGTISCEHGDGLARSPYLPLQFGPLYDVMREIKRLWDPDGRLNPGKVITDEREIHLQDLRVGPDFQPRETGEGFDREPWASELVRCHGCGTCRAYCPVYKVTGEEVASPRGKANLLRAVVAGDLDAADLDDAKMRRIADLCTNCKTCLVECPSDVDVAGLVLRQKEHMAEGGALSLAERMLLNVRPMGRLGSFFAPVSNWATHLPGARWMMEKLAGVDREAAMPRFQHERLREDVAVEPEGAEPVRRIAYFAGCFELFNEPQIGRAAMEVLRELGCEVFVPSQRCCGVPRISSGDTKGALGDMRYNLDALAPLADAGYTIVSGCPSCVLTLTEDWPEMAGGDERARRVADATRDVHQVLAEIAAEREAEGQGPALDAAPWPGKRLAYHAPCHLRAAGRGMLPKELLESLAGVEFVVTSDTCCGMAGTFGLKAKNADLSRVIAEPVFERIKNAGAEAVVTSCGMCRTQLAGGTGLPVVHPMEVLGGER